MGVDKKVFPIKQGVACQLKWTWNTVRIWESTTACCHRVQPVTITPEEFQNFHNHPVWLEHRKMQLAGNFPQQGCQYCETVEKVGGISDRLLHLNDIDVYPPELDSDPLAINVTPRILEIFLNNSCNMSCIYCDESNSSRILKENQKFGYEVPGVPISNLPNSWKIIPEILPGDRSEEMLKEFYIYLEKNYTTLRSLKILGGEPFYQREFPLLIDFILERSNPNLKISITSNLMVSRPILENFMDKMRFALSKRKLAGVELLASIDCLGPEQSYVRYGLDLDQWMSNFEYMISHRWLYVTFNNTITSLTLKTLPDLMRYMQELRKTRPLHHAFSLVTARPHLHPQIFGSGFFDNEFDQILKIMPEENKWEVTTKTYMRGLQTYLNSKEKDLTMQGYLKSYLDEIDRRRNLSWRKVFPWLDQNFQNHKHVV
jgi:organic radical activating enzyme